MKPWLITCASKREFVVYARGESGARMRLHAMLPDERPVETRPHVVEPTIAIIDERGAPGA